MTQTYKQTAKAFMDDFWKFFKKYLEPEDSDEFWDEVQDEADKLMKKYDDDPVFSETVAGYVAGLDEKWRKATGRWKE